MKKLMRSFWRYHPIFDAGRAHGLLRKIAVSTCVFVSTGSASTLMAQNLFRSNDADPNLASYENVFECLAATDREANSYWRFRQNANDTLPNSATDLLADPPPNMTKAAQQCSQKYQAATIPLSEYQQWITLFLQANRDADAKIVAERRLAAVSGVESDSIRSRGKVLSDVAMLFLSVRPVRFAAAEFYIASLQALGQSAFWYDRFVPASRLMAHSGWARDTARLGRSSSWLLAIATNATEQDRNDVNFGINMPNFIAAMRYVHKRELYDSLRKSTIAYAGLQDAKATQIALMALQMGRAASAITGEFVFPDETRASAGTHSSPPADKSVREIPSSSHQVDTDLLQSGHVNMVIQIGNDNEQTVVRMAGMLRRLRTKYPDLNIVIPMQTQGSFGGAAPPPPPLEADYRRRELQHTYRMPGSVVVENSSFWHLPAPDGRRITERGNNAKNYSSGIWLVDKEKRFVYGTPVGKDAESELDELIEILTQRPLAK